MKLTNDSSSFSSSSTKPNENNRLFIVEKEGKALTKKMVNTGSKATKGLKRNLTNWEAFMEDDDDDDGLAEEGLPFDEELDLGLNVSQATQQAQTPLTKRKRA